MLIERARSTQKGAFFMCSVADHGFRHACRRASWSRASVESEQAWLYIHVELRCLKLPKRTLANVFCCHCSLEHQVVATRCTSLNLAKMSLVAWQLIDTRGGGNLDESATQSRVCWSCCRQYTLKHCTYSAVQSLHKRGTHRTRLAQEWHYIFCAPEKNLSSGAHMSHPQLLSHWTFTTSTSSSSFTLPSTTTPEHALQSGQHDLLQEHPVHHQPLQECPVEKHRCQGTHNAPGSRIAQSSLRPKSSFAIWCVTLSTSRTSPSSVGCQVAPSRTTLA